MLHKVFIGSDHAGITLKNQIKEFLTTTLNYQVIDLGTDKKVSCHYPDFAEQMSKQIKPEQKGILVCGSGIGIGIAANKAGIKCSTAFNEYTARQCRKNVQIMALGERIVPFELAKLMIEQFLKSTKSLK